MQPIQTQIDSNKWRFIDVDHLDGVFYQELHAYYVKNRSRVDIQFKTLTTCLLELKCPRKSKGNCGDLRLCFLPIMKLVEYFKKQSGKVLFSSVHANRLNLFGDGFSGFGAVTPHPKPQYPKPSYNYFFFDKQFHSGKSTDRDVRTLSLETLRTLSRTQDQTITLGEFYELWTHSENRCDFMEVNWLFKMISRIQDIYEDVEHIVKLYCGAIRLVDGIGLNRNTSTPEYIPGETTTAVDTIQHTIRLWSQQDEKMEHLIMYIGKLAYPSFIIEVDKLLWSSHFITWKQVVNRIPEHLSDGEVYSWVKGNFQVGIKYYRKLEDHLEIQVFDGCPYTLRDFISHYKHDLNDNYKILPKLERCVRIYLDMRCYLKLLETLKDFCGEKTKITGALVFPSLFR